MRVIEFILHVYFITRTVLVAVVASVPPYSLITVDGDGG